MKFSTPLVEEETGGVLNESELNVVTLPPTPLKQNQPSSEQGK